MTDPFRALVVVAIEQAVAAPYASRLLADAGATVYKVERPEGDFARYYDTWAAGSSSYFVWLNYGKRSVVCDLGTSDGQRVLNALVEHADVVIQNLKPGVLERRNVSLAEHRQRKPDLITCSISGYGVEGPFARRKAYDLLVQADSGLTSITGTADGPGRVGISVVDIATGMHAHQSILRALVRRASGGGGEHIEISMFQAIAEWLAVPLIQYRATGRAPSRAGLAHPGIAPYGAFFCGDGRPVLLSVQNEAEWGRLVAALSPTMVPADADWSSNAARVADRARVDGAVQQALERESFEHVCELLEAADVAFAPLNDIPGLDSHPHLTSIDVSVAGTPFEIPIPASGARERMWGRAVPDLGEHTAEAIAWLESR